MKERTEDNHGEIILYQTPDNQIALEVRYEEETIWLTQKQIAELFGTKRPAITKHLANIYKSGELIESSTCSILEHMGKSGIQKYQTQYFNGLGWIVGPLLGGLMIFQADGKHGSAAFPYTVIGIVVLSVAFVFANIRLPEIKSVTQSVSVNTGIKALWENKLFRFGVIAQFFYVGAQTGINSFFINYVTEINPQITSREAALLLSFGGMGLFMAGRFLGSWMMRFVDPSKLLGIVSMGATICMILVIAAIPWISVSALFICYLFESIMFPTIFALSISGLGENTKQGSSFLIMSIVGGAIAPVLMGLIGAGSMAVGFVVPLICFLIVLGFSIFLQHKNKVLIVNHL